MSPASKPEGLEVEADVGEDSVRVDVAAPGTGVGDTNRGVLRNLTDDAETEVGLILEFRTSIAANLPPSPIWTFTRPSESPK